MSKRNRKKKPGSRRDKAEKEKKEYSIIETEDHALEKLRTRLDEKGALNEQEWRSYEHLMEKKRKRQVQETSEIEEVLPEGQLKDWIEKNYVIQEVVKALDLPIGKEGMIRLLELHGYYSCNLCGYTHVKDEVCPFKIEAKKHNISLKWKPGKEDKEGLIEREVERMLAEEE